MSTATDTDTSTLQGLDFTPSLPCEHSEHGSRHVPTEDASWVAHKRCTCGSARDYLVCESGRRDMVLSEVGVRCPGCGAFRPSAERLSFEPLGGAR